MISSASLSVRYSTEGRRTKNILNNSIELSPGDIAAYFSLIPLFFYSSFGSYIGIYSSLISTFSDVTSMTLTC